MNKSEKLISAILGVILVVWMFNQSNESRKAAAAAAEAEVAVETAAATTEGAQTPAPAASAAEACAPKVEEAPAAPVHALDERLVTLKNDEVELVLSSWGAVVVKETLLKYAEREGEVGEGNPPVTLDFSENPLFALKSVPSLSPDADYELVSATETNAVFRNAVVERTITLRPGYQIDLDERFAQETSVRTALSLGVMNLGAGKNDMLSIDSMRRATPTVKGEVVHYDEEGILKSYLVGGVGGCGGCGGSDASSLPRDSGPVTIGEEQDWIAVKNRFFVTALAETGAENAGFDASVKRDTESAVLRTKSVAVDAAFRSAPLERHFTVYSGPKKQSALWDLGMRDVMEFGMWRWVCYPMVKVLNFFYAIIPNYGIAIILLTILVRIIFWPLTHKSTISMRRMSEVQPLIKELQAKFKDNPQRLQQEMFALYREKKVNPMAGCLPMLVQIPVFIALFTVLRSAVELRYASFLWISDLSEPERLFADWFPFGGLNILPILMAATMALQSALSPTAGDRSQQRMMMVIMPIMMLVMFYSFPSALSLYWTLSQVISIGQMWWIRKRYTPAAATAGVDARETRQMRRHG